MDGRAMAVLCTLLGSERNAPTYIKAWMLGHMILTGKIPMKGIVCPEALGIDPRPFINEITQVRGTYKEEIIG